MFYTIYANHAVLHLRREFQDSRHIAMTLREGLEDYRWLITLERLVRETGDKAGQKLIDDRMNSFRLGQRDHERLFPVGDFKEFRVMVNKAIERLQ